MADAPLTAHEGDLQRRGVHGALLRRRRTGGGRNSQYTRLTGEGQFADWRAADLKSRKTSPKRPAKT